MKLKKEFIVHNSGDEAILVPSGSAGFSGLVRGNETLGAILDLLKSETTEENLIAEMRSRYNAPEGAVESDVAKVLSELRKIGAMEE